MNPWETKIKEKKHQSWKRLSGKGSRRLLQAAIEHEVAEYIGCFQNIKDEQGRRMVVRNGFLPERSILTGIGPLPVKQPRVRDKREGEAITSAILPLYLRRAPFLGTLILTVYRKGVSTGDFMEAPEAILGENAKGLAANTIVRLKRQWETE